MNLLNKIERKLSKYAIKGLIKYIVAINFIVFLLLIFDYTGQKIQRLMLIPEKVYSGEWWRLITYIFIPPDDNIIFIIFILYFYYIIGDSLEREWGSFRFNVYYLLGMIGTTIGAFYFGALGTATFLNLSLLLAFAKVFPEYEILLFFIIPIKIKYLSFIYWAYVLVVMFSGNIAMKLTLIVSLINYFIFFAKEILTGIKHGNKAAFTRNNFINKTIKKDYFHKCTTCGVTEKDNTKLEFRYCVDCEGDYEYCLEHLHSHTHVKQNKT